MYDQITINGARLHNPITNRSPRSTVGTTTEIYTYLRVLYARIGHCPCPKCGFDIPPYYNAQIMDDESDDSVTIEASLHNAQLMAITTLGPRAINAAR